MKKNKLLYTVAIAGIGLLGSCSKGFLERTDPGRLGVEIFYKTEADVNRAVLGVYGQLQTITNSNYIFAELTTDNTTIDLNQSDRGGAAGWEAFDYSTVNPGNAEINNAWIRYYSAIANINTGLDKLTTSPVADEIKKPIEGEFKFLRALFYFDLVRLFGDVVLTTQPLATPMEAFDLLRVSESDVYTQIETDLKDAINLLPQPTAKNGRATKGAAMGILGKVYLTKKEYGKAVTALKDILPLGYDLMEEYADVFSPALKNNKESLFEVQYQGGNDQGEQSNFMYVFAPISSAGVITGFANATFGGRNIPTNNVMSLYAANDKRKNVSFQAGYTKAGTFYPVPFINKYNHPHTISNRTDDNWPILRFSDVLLMLAEAINEDAGPTSEAEGYLNRVKSRAGLTNVTGLGKDAFRTEVLLERRKELAFENHRWFDLKRTLTPAEYVSHMNAHGLEERANPTVPRGVVPFNVQDYIFDLHEYVFPIPAPQILVNDKLTQNKDY